MVIASTGKLTGELRALAWNFFCAFTFACRNFSAIWGKVLRQLRDAFPFLGDPFLAKDAGNGTSTSSTDQGICDMDTFFQLRSLRKQKSG